MADFKTILQLNAEADLRDQPFITQIKNDLIILIDQAILNETVYQVIYPINGVIGSLLPLQKERIKLKIVKRLRDLSYVASFDVNDDLTITWVIATLTTSL